MFKRADKHNQIKLPEHLRTNSASVTGLEINCLIARPNRVLACPRDHPLGQIETNTSSNQIGKVKQLAPSATPQIQDTRLSQRLT